MRLVTGAGGDSVCAGRTSHAGNDEPPRRRTLALKMRFAALADCEESGAGAHRAAAESAFDRGAVCGFMAGCERWRADSVRGVRALRFLCPRGRAPYRIHAQTRPSGAVGSAFCFMRRDFIRTALWPYLSNDETRAVRKRSGARQGGQIYDDGKACAVYGRAQTF